MTRLGEELKKLAKPDESSVDLVCQAHEAACVCHLSLGHDGPHQCRDRIRCNGAWEYRDGEFVTVRMPGEADD